MIEFDPPYNQLVLEKIEDEEKMYGNIVRPVMSEDSAMICRVIAKGPGWITISNAVIPCQVKVGDIIVISRMGGFKLPLDDKNYIFCKDSEVLSILRNYK